MKSSHFCCQLKNSIILKLHKNQITYIFRQENCNFSTLKFDFRGARKGPQLPINNIKTKFFEQHKNRISSSDLMFSIYQTSCRIKPDFMNQIKTIIFQKDIPNELIVNKIQRLTGVFSVKPFDQNLEQTHNQGPLKDFK